MNRVNCKPVALNSFENSESNTEFQDYTELLFRLTSVKSIIFKLMYKYGKTKMIHIIRPHLIRTIIAYIDVLKYIRQMSKQKQNRMLLKANIR